jgi:hypothetical protein
MAYFQTKNPDLGKFWRVLQRKMLVYFTAIWSIVCSLDILMVIFPVLLWFTKKNLATLAQTAKS